MQPEIPTADSLRAAFDGHAALTVGIEEELMILDRDTLDLAPLAGRVLERLGADARLKGELPLAQIESITPPCATVGDAALSLAGSRAELARLDGLAFAAAGLHPFASAEGELSPGERYARTRDEYGWVGRRQMVFGLHVHVRVSGADRAVAVHDALREHLPEIAALAANAPFHDGVDTGMASLRPVISEMLPRQGIPPALGSVDALAAELAWGGRSGHVPDPRTWWWQLRLHPGFGTVEVRVPDQQTTVAETAAVAAFVHSLVADLAARHDAGDLLAAVPGWRIGENAWSAARHGVEGTLADVRTGAPVATRERLLELIERLAPVARELGCGAELEAAAKLAGANGAMLQREAALAGGPPAVARLLAERFCA